MDIFVVKTTMRSILYSKRINASHICPLKRIAVQTEKMKIMVFCKAWTLICKMRIKVMFL